MGICLTDQDLGAFVDGSASVEQMSSWNEHIDTCDACAARVLEAHAARSVWPPPRAPARPDEPEDPQTETATAEPPADAALDAGAGLPEDAIPGYRILKELHRGGQGVVYQAVQESARRKVALKVMLEGPFASKDAKRRFEREIALVGSLRHPNIVPIFDSGVAQGRFFYAMEYIRGEPLAQYVQSRTLSVDDTLRLFERVCDAVDYAHQKGVIHRDLKPSNILVDKRGEPHVLDFGLAKVGGAEVGDDSREMLISVTGQVMGTLPYMSPEQAAGEPDQVDMRSDVYALGVILFELLTGQFPYEVVGQIADVLRNITEAAPRRPSTIRRQINDEVETIILKALAKEKVRRYDTAGALGRDVNRFLAGKPIEAKRDSVLYVVRIALRRYKVPAAVAAAFLVLLTVSSIVAWGLYGEAARARNAEAALRGEADSARDAAIVARQKAVQALYVSDMNSVQDLYAGGNVARAIELLERHRAVYQERFEWRYLWRLCEEGDALHTIRAHSDAVSAVAFSENGVLATGSADGSVKLFDGVTRRELATLKHPSPVRCLALAREGPTLAVGTVDGRVTLWDVRTKRKTDPLEHEGPIRSLAISANGERLAVGVAGRADREDGGDRIAQMRLYDLGSGKELITVSWGPRDVAFSPDGTRLVATGGRGITARLWDMADLQELEPIEQPHTSFISAVAFSPDSNVLATGSWDTEIKLWDAGSRQLLKTLRGHQSMVEWLAFSPDGQTLASASWDGTVRLWRVGDRDPADGEAFAMLRGHTGRVNCVAFSPDGMTLVSGADDQMVKIWPADGPRDRNVLTGNDDWVYTVDFSPDDRTLATGCFDGTVRIWDVETRQPIHSEKLHENQVFTVAFSPSGKWLASCDGVWRTSGSRDFTTPGAAKVSRVDGLVEEVNLPDITTGVRALAFSPDESMLAIGDHNGWLKIWDVPGQDFIFTEKTAAGRIENVVFSPDGKTLAAVHWGKYVTLRSAATFEHRVMFELLAPFELAEGFDAAFSPDSTQLAAGEVRLWDVRTREKRGAFDGHKATVMCIRFSPDGKTLATGSVDHTIRLWSVESGQSVATLRGHTGPVSGLAFSHDGTILASSGQDRTVRLWRAAPITELSDPTFARQPN